MKEEKNKKENEKMKNLIFFLFENYLGGGALHQET